MSSSQFISDHFPSHPTQSASRSADRSNTQLLFCGIGAVLFYIGVNAIVPFYYPGYDPVSQTVSELSAIGSPTRLLWILLMIPYSALVAGFGFGVWLSAGQDRKLKIVGALLIANTVVGLFWPPMHQRGSTATLTDTMHIVFTFVTVSLFVAQMLYAAAALGARFRIYTFVSWTIMMAFGILTGLESPRLAADLPTPWIGLIERISIGAYMVWIIALAVVMMRRTNVRSD